MAMKSQDILVGLQLSIAPNRLTYAALGQQLGMSASETHASVRRLIGARLLESEKDTPLSEPWLKVLVHGVPYVFPAQMEGLTRGIPTAWASPRLKGMFVDQSVNPPVWPSFEGKVQGLAVKPLYPSVPRIVQDNRPLYDLLALVDALRIGRARERKYAEEELALRLKHGRA